MFTSLKDKSVLVTGGTSGIGLGIARCFAARGCKVAITARTKEKADVVAASLRQQGLDVRGYALNVMDGQSVTSLVQKVANDLAGLDVLCANAGVFPFAKLEVMAEADWDLIMNTNAKGTFLCVQAAIPFLKEAEYGRIVITSSITGPITGYPGWAHYAASKAAQLGFMRSAAIELARFGITINAVMPGNIMTEGLQNAGSDYIAGMASAIPIGHLGNVADIGNAALFFASKEAEFVTGQTLVVDGGQVLLESFDALSQ